MLQEQAAPKISHTIQVISKKRYADSENIKSTVSIHDIIVVH